MDTPKPTYVDGATGAEPGDVDALMKAVEKTSESVRKMADSIREMSSAFARLIEERKG